MTIEDVVKKRTKLEEYLDRGHGTCQLRDTRCARLVEAALLHFNNERYEMLAWFVMPNHVHLLVHVWQTPLAKLVRSWRQFVQTEANFATQKRRPPARPSQTERQPPARHTGAEPQPPAPRESSLQQPRFRWEREYWDIYMRDEQQERTAIRYIENNPLKARLCAATGHWPFSSARFRDEHRRLVLPRHDDAARRPEA